MINEITQQTEGENNQVNSPAPNIFPEEVKPAPQKENKADFKIPENQKGSNFLIYLVAILIVLGILGFFLWKYIFAMKNLGYEDKTKVIVVPTVAVTPVSTQSAEMAASNAATANWKTYTNNEFSFKYPNNWKSDANANYKIIRSNTPKASIFIFLSTDISMMNECMKLDETKTVNHLMIKKYSQVTTGEMCGGTDPTPRQIWISKAGGNGYSPGIIYEYKSSEMTQSESIFSQILSTFRFVEGNSSK